MGAKDKVSNTAETAKGKVKEGVGNATGNESMKLKGKGRQASGNVKQAGENVKDAVKGVAK